MSTRLQTCGARRRMGGVTLLELMMVVVVIGVLGAIAIPSYRSYSMRAHRTDAKNALLSLATSQERYYLKHRTYGTLAQLAADGYPTASEYGMYTLAITVSNATTFTATAVPAPGGGTNGVDMTKDTQCSSFSIDARGVRGASNPNCW